MLHFLFNLLLPRRLLGYLLHVANSSPPYDSRDFYVLKERLLKRYGVLVGEDIQHIQKECWGEYHDGCGPKCRRCGGTGVFQHLYIRLERWELGGFQFHCPRERITKWNGQPSTIMGYVKHRSYGSWSKEAALWLALVFDRGYFWKLLTTSLPLGWRWQPLVNLNRLAYHVRWLPNRIRYAPQFWFLHKCIQCGHHYQDWRGRNHYFCHQCRHIKTDDYGIPF